MRGPAGWAAWLALVLCCSLLVVACQSAWHGALGPVTRALDACRGTLPDPFYPEEHVPMTRAMAGAAIIEHRVKPATISAGKCQLTIEDCRGLALKNNLDIQVAGFDEITKRALEFSNRARLLPHLAISGELSERNNQRWAYSDSMGSEGREPARGGGGSVNNWSVGTERNTFRGLAELSWSPTDAALAFYLARSSTNDRLKAHYHRIRVAQKLIGVVEAAYFRLLSLQQVTPVAHELVRVRKRVRDRTAELVSRQLAEYSYQKTIQSDRPVDPKSAEQDLIKARRLLARLSNQVERQRNILASAVGLSPDYLGNCGFCVVGPLTTPSLSGEMALLELTAIQNRPEAYEAGLNHLNSINDVNRTIVKFFPKITGFWKLTADKDKYSLNKAWHEVGVRASLDLLDLLTNYGESQAADSNVAKTGREVATVALGITSQVRAEALKYFDAADDLHSAESALESFRKVLRIAERKSSRMATTGLVLLKARGDVMEQKISHIRALGEANAALAELRSALGTNYQEGFPGH